MLILHSTLQVCINLFQWKSKILRGYRVLYLDHITMFYFCIKTLWSHQWEIFSILPLVLFSIVRRSVSCNVNTSEKVGTHCFSPRWQKHEGDAQETFGSVSTRNTETVLLGICLHLFSQESHLLKKSYRKSSVLVFISEVPSGEGMRMEQDPWGPYSLHPCSPNPVGPETPRLIRHLRWVGRGCALVGKFSLGDCHAFSHSLLLPEKSLSSYT